MNIFKRNSKDTDTDADFTIEGENSIEAGHVLSSELDENAQKLIENNEISDASDADEMPSANTSDRQGNSKKKLQLAGLALVALLAVLIGLGTTVSKLNKNKELKRIEEAEQKALEQKTMANGNVNIEDDQRDIKSREMFEIPPPAALEEPLPPVEPLPPMSAPSPVEPPAIIPPQSFNANNGGLVAGVDYVEPPAIIPPQNNGGLFAGSRPVEEPAPQPVPQPETKQDPIILIPSIKGGDSDVMVDTGKTSNGSTGDKTNSDSGVGGNLNPSNLAGANADRKFADSSMILLKGTTIPCVLKTRIDSTYKGFTVCQLSRDVYSSNGKTLVLERGSQVFGEQNIQIEEGQARVSVLWNRITTPKGVTVNVNSPAAGRLGEMGVAGNIDNHFAEKFGASILLSVIQDGLEVAQNRLEEKDTGDGTTINNTSNSAESIAEKALEGSINIKPTATINQGTVISIMVARDVDFSDVYKLEQR